VVAASPTAPPPLATATFLHRCRLRRTRRARRSDDGRPAHRLRSPAATDRLDDLRLNAITWRHGRPALADDRLVFESEHSRR
jgi:hypothetical protein